LVSVNVSWDKDAPAKKFVEEYHLPFPAGRDTDARIGNLYGVEATPTTLFIGKDGKLVERNEGALEEAEFDQRINLLLAS
jgi:peroxiredoxin